MILRRPRLFSAALLFAAVTARATDALSQAQFTCGDAADSPGVTASDALAVLRSAVGLEECSLCICDTDGSNKVSAPDALFTLKKGVGQPVTLRCPFCCSLCECTPQELTLTLAGVATCDGCIPRVPPSNDVNSITMDFADDPNGEYVLPAIAECVWQTNVPALIAQKILYGSSTDCNGVSNSFTDVDVVMRVERTEDGWELFAGMYSVALRWGDVARASIATAACDVGDSAPSANAACELAGANDPQDYDMHATGGSASIEISDPQPVCP
jgi:hypothetical protein